MIEIKIPKEIKNYREKLFFGLNLKQSICAGIALLICVPLYIFGTKYLPREAVSWTVIFIAAPLMLIGFFRFNDMNFEKFIIALLKYSIYPKKRIYESEPILMELRKEYLEEEYKISNDKFKNRNKEMKSSEAEDKAK